MVAGGLAILFGMWWLYFDRPVGHALTNNRAAFVWGYGHLFVYAAIGAVGAALAAAVDAATGEGHVSVAAAAMPIVAGLPYGLVWVGLLVAALAAGTQHSLPGRRVLFGGHSGG